MKILVFLVIVCFGLSGWVSSRVTIKESDIINGSQADDETLVMNPYEYYNLDKTSKIVIQMEKSVEIGPDNTIEVPLEKVLIDNKDQKAVLAELKKEAGYDNDFCLCSGNGDLYFTLTDGKELKFRLKHGGEVLDERFNSGNESRMFYPHENFVKIIRKYYPEKMRKYYEIEDRRRRGEISEEQREQEWLAEIMSKYFPGDYWSNLVDDPVMRDEYFNKTIIGSWKILPSDGENLNSVDTFLSDGEAWHKGDFKIPDRIVEETSIRSQWEVKDGSLCLKVESVNGQDVKQEGQQLKYKIMFMDDKFMSLLNENDQELDYMKVD